MDLDKTSLPEFFTGQQTATETPTPLVQAGHAPQTVQRGTLVKLTSGGPVYVGRSNVRPTTGYTLGVVGESVLVPVEPRKIFIVGDGVVGWEVA